MKEYVFEKMVESKNIYLTDMLDFSISSSELKVKVASLLEEQKQYSKAVALLATVQTEHAERVIFSCMLKSKDLFLPSQCPDLLHGKWKSLLKCEKSVDYLDQSLLKKKSLLFSFLSLINVVVSKGCNRIDGKEVMNLLSVPLETAEELFVDSVSAGVVSGKIDQLQGVFLIDHCVFTTGNSSSNAKLLCLATSLSSLIK